MTRKLKVPCGRITAGGQVCTYIARDSLGCFAHSENFAEARRARASKGGRLGGRARHSIAAEIAELRKLVGIVIELKAQDRLPLHIDCRMPEFLKLIKSYVTLAQLEVRTAKSADDLLPKQAFDNRHLLDTHALRAQLEDPDDAA